MLLVTLLYPTTPPQKEISTVTHGRHETPSTMPLDPDDVLNKLLMTKTSKLCDLKYL